MKQILVSTFLAGLLISGVSVAGDAAMGQTKSAACAGCHGVDGNSAAPMWPNLAGQSSTYLTKQLNDFKSGARKDATMTAMASPLSETDIDDIATYFSSKAVKVGTAAKDKVEMCAMIYRAGNAERGISACTACHGPSGTGNIQAKFPALSGQKATYVVKTLNSFASGERSNDASSMMRDIASRMTTADMEAVAQYIQGLH